MEVLNAKVVILGDQGVGKTSLITRQVDDTFTKDTMSTLGACNYTVTVPLHYLKVRIRVWDTAGQERFRSIVPLYYRGAQGALLIYDITNRDSFESIKRWVQELKGHVMHSMVLFIIGNKLDLTEERTVSRDEVLLYSNQIGARHFECSAKDKIGVDPIFQTLAHQIASQHNISPELMTTVEAPNPLLAQSTDEIATDVGYVEEPGGSIDAFALATSVNRTHCC